MIEPPHHCRACQGKTLDGPWSNATWFCNTCGRTVDGSGAVILSKAVVTAGPSAWTHAKDAKPASLRRVK